MDARDFARYEDPAKAGRVWSEYFPNFFETSYLILNKAVRAYEECTSSEELDLKLDGITTGRELYLGMNRVPRRLRSSDGIPFEDMSVEKFASPDIWRVASASSVYNKI